MDVVIRFERQEPPTGSVAMLPLDHGPNADPMAELPFVGWLGLLRALAQLTGQAGDGHGR